MKEHSHNFDESDWPFEEPINHVAFTTKQVAYEGHPVHLISHDEDGDWQFLCGTTNDTEDAVVACLGCIFERHPFVKEFSSMPRGWLAWRQNDNSEWHMERHEPEDG